MTRARGQPCGCDPAANHVCEEHGAAVDTTVADIFVGDDPAGLQVSGPNSTGFFTIRRHDGAHPVAVCLSRFEVEDLIDELRRRLKLRG